MHELALATNILEIATAEASAAAAGEIRRVVVEVGRLAGVETEALKFCFELARQGTPAAGASLHIIDTPGIGRCPGCSAETSIEPMSPGCPRCGEGLEIMQGRELRVCSIDVD